MSPVQELVGAVARYQTGSAALTRVQEALALPASDAEPASASFTDVRFRYADDLPFVHHGVTFAVSPRGMTAFVGPSGAGRTTVFSLIERFYDPEEGAATPDGRPVAKWDLPELRSAIGYVEQDAPALSGSPLDNLPLGNPDADDDAVGRVLRTTRLDAGKVRAVGTHRELVGADPLYAELAATQFPAAEDSPPQAVN